MRQGRDGVTNDLDEVPATAVPPGSAQPQRGAERAVWTERMLEALERGGPEGGRWYWLHDKVFAEKTLRAAFTRVKRNGGAPGVDGVTVEMFESRLGEEIARLQKAWGDETFRPQPIRRTWIPKPGTDEQRPLGIPTVRDRVVQAAMVLVLEPIFEKTFNEHSHGFRPGRSAHDALNAVLRHLRSGKTWVVDADLKGYFDSIPHPRLLDEVRRKVTDRRVLALIGDFLTAGVMDGDQMTEPEAGTPQGGVISPLLANIYLNSLDHEMEAAGWAMERYADDFVICCATEDEAQAALRQVQDWTARVGLTLHPTKTRLVNLGTPGEHLDFLGYRLQPYINRAGNRMLLRFVRPKSLAKIKATLNARTPRKSGDSLAEQVKRLNRVLRGWFGYFRSATKSVHVKLDKHVRRRLRAMLCKRHGMRMIWSRGDALRRWPNAFFDEQGLFSLEVAHVRYYQAHRGAR